MTQEEYKEAVKAKADELNLKFTDTTHPMSRIMVNGLLCAIIAVQEILDLDVWWYRKEAIGKPDFIRPKTMREFWEDVMNELNRRL